MRITGGFLCGRAVPRPGRHVRPTQDRVREALFASLGDRVPGARALDLFAGSGVVGLEAWSRGARAVWWVESRRSTVRLLRENVRRLCAAGEGVARGLRIVEREVLAFLAAEGGAGEAFDLVYADPPYDRAGQHAWLERLLAALALGGWVAPSGLFVMEQARRQHRPEAANGWDLVADKRYGDTRLLFFSPEARSSGVEQ
jgi:16S rRNA (guanine966-N2)-methyltransferase